MSKSTKKSKPELFGHYNSALDRPMDDPLYLERPTKAQIVAESILAVFLLAAAVAAVIFIVKG